MSTAPLPWSTTALRWAGGVLGALAIAAGGFQAADHLAHRTTETAWTYPATDRVELMADGAITLTTGGTDVEVLARSRTGLTMTSYTVDRVKGRLTVSHRCPHTFVVSSCTASLEVRVPAGARVSLQSSAGALSVVDVVGDVEAGTRTGSITVDGVTGRVLASSGAGSVEVGRVSGSVDAVTSVGRVVVHEAGGAVVAHSGSGSIDVSGAKGSVEATTSIGSVTVRGVAGDAVVGSGSGGLEVAAVQGNVRATTSIGRVVVRSTGAPVALDIATKIGRTTVDAPTDPAATRSVYIRSGSGDVAYVAGGG